MKERTEKEKVAYLVGKYFNNQMTLQSLKTHIECIIRNRSEK